MPSTYPKIPGGYGVYYVTRFLNQTLAYEKILYLRSQCTDNVRFFAYHGVGQQEREVGNEFVINLKLKVDIARAAETDDVTHTVSYADVYENVKAEMEIPSKLLEHVCGRIIKRLFRTFPTVKAIELKLAKRNPPMGADLDAAGVEVQCERA